MVFHPAKGSTTGHDLVPRSADGHGPARLDPFESLAALTDHIPDKGHLVRFYGWYSHKNRGLRKKRAVENSPAAGSSLDDSGAIDPSTASDAFTSSGGAPPDFRDDDFRKECRRTWARMLKKVYQVDPLLCLHAGIAAHFVLDFPPPRGQNVALQRYPKNQITYPWIAA